MFQLSLFQKIPNGRLTFNFKDPIRVHSMEKIVEGSFSPGKKEQQGPIRVSAGHPKVEGTQRATGGIGRPPKGPLAGHQMPLERVRKEPQERGSRSPPKPQKKPTQHLAWAHPHLAEIHHHTPPRSPQGPAKVPPRSHCHAARVPQGPPQGPTQGPTAGPLPRGKGPARVPPRCRQGPPKVPLRSHRGSTATPQGVHCHAAKGPLPRGKGSTATRQGVHCQ